MDDRFREPRRGGKVGLCYDNLGASESVTVYFVISLSLSRDFVPLSGLNWW